MKIIKPGTVRFAVALIDEDIRIDGFHFDPEGKPWSDAEAVQAVCEHVIGRLQTCHAAQGTGYFQSCIAENNGVGTCTLKGEGEIFIGEHDGDVRVSWFIFSRPLEEAHGAVVNYVRDLFARVDIPPGQVLPSKVRWIDNHPTGDGA